MTWKYEIVLDGQLGPRLGTLTWAEDGENITGTFSLLGFDNPVSGRRDRKALELFHELRTAVSVLTCHTSARLQGDELCGTVTAGHCLMNFHGKKSMERAREQA